MAKTRMLKSIFGIALLSTLLAASPAFAEMQPPPPDGDPADCPTREEAAAHYQAGMTESQIMALYPYCPWPVPTPWSPLPSNSQWDPKYPVPNPPQKWIDNNGNVFWEGIDSCGYQPQTKIFSCVIEVRQTNQYWGFPEWVRFCVDYGDGLGFTTVNTGSVRVSNEPFGQAPIWYFAVNAPADARLAALPLNSRTMVARAALSWLFPPVSCNAPFFWGNTATFRIRLDP